jgi:hypothetical protein
VPVLEEEAVRSAVYAAVADLNDTLSDGHKIPLVGTADVFSAIDSLGALNLVLRIEDRLRDALGCDVDLMDGDLYEKTLFVSPTLDDLAHGVFRTLRTTQR